MVRYDKHAWAAADAIHERLLQVYQTPCSLYMSADPWQELNRLLRQIMRASSLGWHKAHRRLLDNLQVQIRQFREGLKYLLVDAHKRTTEQPPLGMAEIYRDLVALKRDFSEVLIEPGSQEVVVVTEPIVLEDICLGAFEIQLDYRELDLSYRVVALEPNPAAGREDITHPHVMDDQLCEGEGRTAIHAALTQGRLGDFFLMVAQILANYAPGQAYVEMADWEGVICSACSTTISAHDRYCCEHCETTLCDECFVLCTQCGLVCCSDCTDYCDGCNEAHCQSCLETCPRCGQRLCRSCREGEHPKHCEDHDDHEDSQSAARPQGTSLDTVASR